MLKLGSTRQIRAVGHHIFKLCLSEKKERQWDGQVGTDTGSTAMKYMGSFTFPGGSWQARSEVFAGCICDYLLSHLWIGRDF